MYKQAILDKIPKSMRIELTFIMLIVLIILLKQALQLQIFSS